MRSYRQGRQLCDRYVLHRPPPYARRPPVRDAREAGRYRTGTGNIECPPPHIIIAVEFNRGWSRTDWHVQQMERVHAHEALTASRGSASVHERINIFLFFASFYTRQGTEEIRAIVCDPSPDRGFFFSRPWGSHISLTRCFTVISFFREGEDGEGGPARAWLFADQKVWPGLRADRGSKQGRRVAFGIIKRMPRPWSQKKDGTGQGNG